MFLHRSGKKPRWWTANAVNTRYPDCTPSHQSPWWYTLLHCFLLSCRRTTWIALFSQTLGRKKERKQKERKKLPQAFPFYNSSNPINRLDSIYISSPTHFFNLSVFALCKTRTKQPPPPNNSVTNADPLYAKLQLSTVNDIYYVHKTNWIWFWEFRLKLFFLNNKARLQMNYERPCDVLVGVIMNKTEIEGLHEK